MNEFLWSVVMLTFGFATGIFMGSFDANVSWSNDCAKMGSHRYGANVYECKERK